MAPYRRTGRTAGLFGVIRSADVHPYPEGIIRVKKRLHITILDLTAKGPTRGLYARLMHANLASIMPQVVAVWCEQAGHDVRFICYTGFEDLEKELLNDTDVLFVGAFTEAAQMAYSISAMFRKKGAITILGGPHARCYPDDAVKHFDYVLGFTDQKLVQQILSAPTQHRPTGVQVAARNQPLELPGIRERWKFLGPTVAKAPTIKMVGMIGSLGCPYTCSFCIDANVPYQPLSYEVMKEDLRFLLTKFKRPMVGWHDPNFGIRFEETLGAIEEAIPANSIDFVAESSLSILTEPHLKRMAKNGFGGILPGIESWYTLGGKSKTGRVYGEEKVRQVAEHVNMILSYLPYVQTNFVLGLDDDAGSEPFELTKLFMELTPGAFPGFSLLTCFGQAAPINLDLMRTGRVLPFPFHFLNNNGAMNVKPKNYEWPEFYDNVVSLTRDAFSWRRIGRRFNSNVGAIPKWMNLVRAVSSEGFGRTQYYGQIRKKLDTDVSLRRYFEGETTVLPDFYHDIIKKELGSFYQHLPAGSIDHDPLAYLKKQPAGSTDNGRAVKAGMASGGGHGGALATGITEDDDAPMFAPEPAPAP